MITLTADDYNALLAERERLAQQLRTITVGGAKASANLYSLIETCKANRIDPYTYLVALFRKLPSARTTDDFEALLPWYLTKATA